LRWPARADDARFGGLRRRSAGRNGARLLQQLLETLRLAGLRDEVDGAERPRVARVCFVVLAGQNQDLDIGRQREQFVDQPKAFIRPVRSRRQSKIDQGELGGFLQLLQSGFHLCA
jgi:hypothetical protein